ncbi:hypothetical protein [Arcanobacterium ihumii]|uniref:hypothetical protein n=1 Tax=Arcanobacterium ihumii TaxID=2138162 RepID=UPI000F525988|nr:hypothetical protein [Arcanobacterium ihumii]
MLTMETCEAKPVFITAKQDHRLHLTTPIAFVTAMALFTLIGIVATIPSLIFAAGVVTTFAIPAWLVVAINNKQKSTIE